MASVTRAVKEELVALGYKLRPGRVLSTLGSLCLETPDVPLSQFIPSTEFCFSLTEKGQRAEAGREGSLQSFDVGAGGWRESRGSR